MWNQGGWVEGAGHGGVVKSEARCSCRPPQVKYTDDRRSVFVTTKASAPGGVRNCKVALPFDPDLFDTMVEHG
jgi:hypothetical protein